MSKNSSKTVYADKDYVRVGLKGAEEPLPDPVPRAWLGTELLEPDVVEFKEGSSSKASEPVVIPEGEPTDDWTIKQLDAYADREDIDLTGVGAKKDERLAAILAAKKTQEVNGD